VNFELIFENTKIISNTDYSYIFYFWQVRQVLWHV